MKNGGTANQLTKPTTRMKIENKLCNICRLFGFYLWFTRKMMPNFMVHYKIQYHHGKQKPKRQNKIYPQQEFHLRKYS